MVCEDFNEILFANEKVSGVSRVEGHMKAFREVIEECCLLDSRYLNSWFTWERGNFSETNIIERLERGLACKVWVELFPNANIQHLPHSFLDYCPLLICTNQDINSLRIRQFHFEAWWVLERSFIDKVKSLWASSNGGHL